MAAPCDGDEEKCLCYVRFIIFGIGIIFTILCFVFNCLAFIYKPYNEEWYKDVIENWKLSPINSIEINHDNLNDVLNNKIIFNTIDIITLKRIKSKYNYKYLFLNNDKNHHPCGMDIFNNFLFLPNNMECPINFIELSNNKSPMDKKFNYTTITISDNLFLHYSNNNIYGYLYNNISLEITERNSLEGYKLNDNLILNLITNNYSAYKNSQKEKIFFVAAFNSKQIRIAINCITFILLIITIINFILTMINKHLIGLHLLNILFLSLNIILEIIIRIYLENNEFLNYKYYTDKKANYSYYLFAFFCVLCADYLAICSYIHPESNFYLILIYPIRYGFDCQIFDECVKEQNNFENILNQLNSEIEHYENQKILFNEKIHKISEEFKKNED